VSFWLMWGRCTSTSAREDTSASFTHNQCANLPKGKALHFVSERAQDILGRVGGPANTNRGRSPVRTAVKAKEEKAVAATTTAVESPISTFQERPSQEFSEHLR
jgi:hypothetical protein